MNVDVNVNELYYELIDLDADVKKLAQILEEKQARIQEIMQGNADLLLHDTKKASKTFDYSGRKITVEVKAIDRKTYYPEVELELQRAKREHEDAIAPEKKRYKSTRKKIQVEAQNAGKFDTKRSFYCKVT